MSTTFDDYRESFPNVGFARDDNGVREIQLHTNDATLHFDGHAHEQPCHPTPT